MFLGMFPAYKDGSNPISEIFTRLISLIPFDMKENPKTEEYFNKIPESLILSP